MRTHRLRTHETTLVLFSLSVILVTYFVTVLQGTASGAFPSPDESSAHLFSMHLADTGTLRIPEPGNDSQSPIISPRNAVAIDGAIVPGGFLGLPLWYGSIGALIGSWSIPFLTPLLSVIGLACFYYLVRMLFDRTTAILSLWMSATLIPFWYLTARSLTHNTPIVSLLLIGCALYCWKRKGSPSYLAFLVGLVFGIAMTFRYNEALWILPLGLFALWRDRVPNRDWKFFVVLGFLLSWVPILILNQELYGGWFETGYLTLGNSDVATHQLHSLRRTIESPLSIFQQILFPFGWNASLLWNNVSYYLGALQPLFLPIVSIGVIAAFLLGRQKRAVTRYLVVTLFITLWLVLYYGSGSFFGSAAEFGNGILGASFLRYWLPIFVLLGPLAAYGIVASVRLVKHRWAQIGILIASVGSLAFFSGQQVLLDPSYGLHQLHRDAIATNNRQELLLTFIPTHSVIVAGTLDKELSPTFRVIGFGRNANPTTLFPDIAVLSESQVVYWAARTAQELDLLRVQAFTAGILLQPTVTVDSYLYIARVVPLEADQVSVLE